MFHAFLAFVFQGDPSAAGGATPPAGGAPQQAPGLMDAISGMAFPLILCLVVFWVFMIGPERKQRKKREEMLKGLEKGDEVVTTSGMHGSVVQVQDGVVTLQVADGVRLRFALQSIGSVSEKTAGAKS